MSEFTQYDDARRSRILEAALAEFARKGYRKSSTNTIVREAKVSKGLLFHYFISKKELYILLYKIALETITNELYEGVNFADRDVLNRLSQSTLQKIASYQRHPEFVKLFEHNATVEDEEILSRTAVFSKQYADESYQRLFSNIDYYLFSDRININHALEVVKWTIDRISINWVKQHNHQLIGANYDELSDEINVYLDLFRNAFYK